MDTHCAICWLTVTTFDWMVIETNEVQSSNAQRSSTYNDTTCPTSLVKMVKKTKIPHSKVIARNECWSFGAECSDSDGREKIIYLFWDICSSTCERQCKANQ